MPFVVNEYGTPIEVSDAEAADMVADPTSGLRLESPEQQALRVEQEQYGGLDEQAIAALEAGASGATLGLSDVALSETLGNEYRAERARRERLFPGTTTAGEIAGAVAPLILSGGGSAAATGARVIGMPTRALAGAGRAAESVVGTGLRAAGVTGESIGGRALLRGSQFAASGAIEGAGYEVGRELSEAALAPDGNYDKLGEKLLAAAGRGGKVGFFAGGAIGGVTGAGGALLERGATRLFKGKAADQVLGDISEEAAVRAIDASKKAHRTLVLTGGEKKIGRELLDHDIVRAGRSNEEMLARAERVAEEQGSTIGTLLKAADDAGGRVASGVLFTKIDDLISKRAAKLSRAERNVAKELSDEVGPLREAAEAGTLTHTQLHDYRRILDRQITWSKANKTLLQDDLVKMRGLVEESLEQSAEKAFSAAGREGFRGAYRSAKSAYRAARWASDQLIDNMARGQTNRLIGLLEHMQGVGGAVAGAATGSIGLGAGVGIGAALLGRVIRDKGWGVVATLADQMRRADQRMGQSVRKFLTAKSDVRRVGLAAGESEVAESRADRALKRKPAEKQIDAYRRRMTEITSYNADTVKRQIAPFASTPGIAMAVAGSLARGRDYLLREAPGGMISDDPLVPHLNLPTVDPVDLETFANKLQIVEDPDSILEEMQSGAVRPEHVEALQEVYPERYEDLKEAVRTELLELKEPPSYEQRITLGVLFDLPTDKSLEPAAIFAAQSIYAPPVDDATGTPQPGNQPGPNTDIAKDFMSGSDKIEGMAAAV
jgi:hypothetical protein